MTKSKRDFQSLLHNYMVLRGLEPSEIVADDDYTLDVSGRIVQIRTGEPGSMLLSTMVFFESEQMPPSLLLPIAEFNAFHLSSGGFSLLKDPQSGSLYVEQELRIKRFDAETLRSSLEDFADRATSCVRWYQAELLQSYTEKKQRQKIAV